MSHTFHNWGMKIFEINSMSLGRPNTSLEKMPVPCPVDGFSICRGINYNILALTEIPRFRAPSMPPTCPSPALFPSLYFPLGKYNW